MFVWLLLGMVVLVGGLALLRAFVAVNPRVLVHGLTVAAVVVLAIASLALVATGRIGWMIGLLPFLLPLVLRRWGGSGGGWRGPGFGRGSGASSVRTAYLDMHLDHATGVLDGQVLQGAMAGQRLASLTREDVLSLLATLLQQDRKSARLLEAYLDRRFPDWRQQSGAGGPAGDGTNDEQVDEGGAPGPQTTPLSRDDAYRILGLSAGASEAEIRAAHHRLIVGVHPDRGGSALLAAQVNRARDVLLGKTNH